MPVFNNNILAGASGATGGGGSDERSLRFNSGDSSYLNRTPSSAGNRKTWTWSGWIKIDGNFANRNTNYGGSIFFGTHDGQPTWISYNATDPYLQFSFNDGSSYRHNRSQAVFRDSSAWYHVVVALDTTQGTASNRLKMYVNGVQLTDFSTSYTIPQNTQVGFNNTFPHNLGASSASTSGTAYDHFGGLMANIHFVDGQALTYTAFTEFDTNGVLQPKAYSGTYGTNGFHLDFKDNSSTAALGNDAAGSNNWTVNNFSVAAGAGNDSLRDSPYQIADQTDSGSGGTVVGNYCTWNRLGTSTYTLANGNLDASFSGGTTNLVFGTIGVTSGKWYWEIQPTSSVYGMFGIVDLGVSESLMNYAQAGGLYLDQGSGTLYGQLGGSFSGASYASAIAVNDIVGVALDMDNGNVTFYKNGVSLGVANTSTLVGKTIAAGYGNAGAATATSVNFGQRAFANSNVPSGYKSINTANLPTPTIADGSKYFEAKKYDGNGGTQTISNLEFSPDFTWLKKRSGSADHYLYDQVRGATYRLYSNVGLAESTSSTGLTAFTSDGFSLGNANDVNQSSNTYISWNWDAGTSTVTNNDGTIASSIRASAASGFSIVTWTGNGQNNASVGHGLNAPPSIVIIKNRSSVTSFHTYVRALDSTGQYQLYLDGTQASANFGSPFFNTDSTKINLVGGSSAGINASGNFVAWCFAPVESYQVMGSYIGNGNALGPFVFTGFRPRLILIKRAVGGTANWCLYDSARDTFNDATHVLSPDTSAGGNPNDAFVSDVSVDFLSNGFRIVDVDGEINANTNTYIYYAVAENPFKTARAR